MQYCKKLMGVHSSFCKGPRQIFDQNLSYSNASFVICHYVQCRVVKKRKTMTQKLSQLLLFENATTFSQMSKVDNYSIVIFFLKKGHITCGVCACFCQPNALPGFTQRSQKGHFGLTVLQLQIIKYTKFCPKW